MINKLVRIVRGIKEDEAERFLQEYNRRHIACILSMYRAPLHHHETHA